MDDNKLLFARTLKDIRQKKGLSQEDVSEISYININTISKMENGKCNYDIDKLESLSDIYGVDLIEKYFKTFYEDNNIIDSIINSLNNKDRINGSTLDNEIDKLEKIKEKSDRSVISKKSEKLILFLKSIEEKDSKKRRKLILKALNIDGKFDLEDLSNNYYDYIDYRILMNFGQTFKNPKDRIKVYKFIEKAYFSNNNLKSILYHNIAIDYYILDENSKALEYIDNAIYIKSYNSPSPVMLYTKALILESLGLPSDKYIKKSLEIAKLQGDDIYNTILEHWENRH